LVGKIFEDLREALSGTIVSDFDLIGLVWQAPSSFDINGSGLSSAAG